MRLTRPRPGSPGRNRSACVRPQTWMASYELYMDSFGGSDRPPADDDCRAVAIGVLGEGRGHGHANRVRREGEGILHRDGQHRRNQHFEFNRLFPRARTGARRTRLTIHPLLVLKYYVLAGSEAWIDDAELYRSDQSNPTAFNDAIVGKLKELRPGVLRDWGNQLGSSLDNQLAEPFARKTLGWRPHNRNAGNFSYSLHEFLELCKEVAAEPWYVIPPTWTHQEMIDLCEYLCAPADGAHPYADYRAELGQVEPWSSVFPSIHLEWGNEMWGAASGGDPFFGASALGGERLGTMAHDHFGTMKDYGPYFDPAKFDFVIGGQVGWPGRQGDRAVQFEPQHRAGAVFGSCPTSGLDQEFSPVARETFLRGGAGNMRQSKTISTKQGGHARIDLR